MDRPNFKRHIPGLDGLRGVAVALVVIYHFVAGWPYWTQRAAVVAGHFMRGGWVGVDVFFVLSGYLITGILIDESASPRRWTKFMARRALRIVPAFYTVLLLVFVVLPAVLGALSPAGARSPFLDGDLASSWPWFWGYLSNIRQLNPPHFPMALSITWSLAVEEQFYLVWPLAVWSMAPEKRRGFIVLTIALGVAAKIAWFALTKNATGLRYLTPCCIDEFGWGALVAVLLRESRFDASTWQALRVWGLRVGLPAAALMILLRSLLHPLLGTVLVSLSVGWAVAALIMTCVEGRTSIIRRVTEARALGVLGKYSYGIYLTHALFLPWFAISRPGISPLRLSDAAAHAASFAAYALLTMLAAYLLYRLVERPMLRFKLRFQ